ncbi:MAG: transferase [Bacillales bacterium]|nr:transferase [Bacillales bacterium]
MIYPYKDKTPKIDSSVFVADYVTIIGDVEIEEESSVWFNTTIRADLAPVRIGKGVNIQESSVIHQSTDIPVIIEDKVTIGHNVVLHSCTIRKGALIGMGAVVLDGAEVGEETLIAAGAVVTPGKVIPPRSLAVGNPAKVVRELTEKDIEDMYRGQRSYVEKAKYYKSIVKSL